MSAPLRAIKPWVRKAAVRVVKRAPPPTIKHWNVLTGDTVQVMSGGGKGVTGVVRKVLRKQNRVIVAGANFVKRHVRASASGPGGVVSMESPVHVSNVALIDPVSGCV
jgi:large subunit ribosomal protein L24